MEIRTALEGMPPASGRGTIRLALSMPIRKGLVFPFARPRR
ncbi:hypothetical protein [Brevibacterium luteolum]|nr:hypothetical protein [Brevibacterium luteolum]